MFDDAESVAQPLYDGACNKDRSFEGIFGFAIDFPGDGGEQVVMGDHGFFARVHQHEAACSISVLYHSGCSA